MRILRLIKQAAFFLLALPFALLMVSIGFFIARKTADEEIVDDAAALVATEELDDAELELSTDEKQRRWLEDLSPSDRGRRIRQGAAVLRFKPVIPFIMRRRR